MQELSRANFREIVGVDKMVLIECWAPGCGACKKFDPVFAEAETRHPDHVFARMNIMTDEKLGELFEIEYTPCLMLYRDGLLLLKQPGNYNSESLEEIIQQGASLDMEQVKADMADQDDSESVS